ncbi:CfrBI family restriction endonuclease [Geminocystis sp. CENA526]|uniref:CfrBI family restriction endonuclease n=1 Tax=Geminocystis sp. CENA526 TaxID=1355871 RepID=UPI003D6DECA9
MTLTDQVIKNIIKRLIKGQDYRIEVIALINAEFLQFAIEFFKQIVDAKLKNKDLTQDWYKNYFLDPKLTSKEIAINSGLNTKTITNMYNSASKQIVINASNEHYDVLYESISNLIENENEIDLTLTIKFRGVSVDLNINESLIVINTLAVKRAALRGGLWSTAGKKVEKYLMASLCYLFDVPLLHFDQTNIPESMREVDFYLINNENYYRCEVKLMGKGNPESADAIFARETNVFVADKLSNLNKEQADILGVNWVELRAENGFMKFAEILEKLNIPHHSLIEDLDTKVAKILTQLIKI